MPSIRVDEKKPFDICLRQFRRVCERDGIIKEARERQEYIKPTEQRKIAKRRAISRAKKSESRSFSS